MMNLTEWILNLDESKLTILAQELNNGKDFNWNRMLDTMKIEAVELKDFISSHAIEYLGGGNSHNFKVTSSISGAVQVLKLENRLNNPDTLENSLRKKDIIFDTQRYFINIAMSRPVTVKITHDTLGGKTVKNEARFLKVTDYCQGNDLTTCAGTTQTTEERLAGARHIYTQMAEALVCLEGRKAFHPDMKNSNWLLDDTGHLKIADTKALCPSPYSYAFYRDKCKKLGYNVIGTGYIAPPELWKYLTSSTNAVISPTKAQAYMFGKNLYEYLASNPPSHTLKDMIASMETEHNGERYDFSAAIFNSFEGNRYKLLICACIKNGPADRINIKDVEQCMVAIQSLINSPKLPHLQADFKQEYDDLLALRLRSSPGLQADIFYQLQDYDRRLQSPRLNVTQFAELTQEMKHYHTLIFGKNFQESLTSATLSPFESSRYQLLIDACIKDNPEERLNMQQVKQAITAIEGLKSRPELEDARAEARDALIDLSHQAPAPALKHEISAKLKHYHQRYQDPMLDATRYSALIQEMKHYSQSIAKQLSGPAGRVSEDALKQQKTLRAEYQNITSNKATSHVESEHSPKGK